MCVYMQLLILFQNLFHLSIDPDPPDFTRPVWDTTLNQMFLFVCTVILFLVSLAFLNPLGHTIQHHITSVPALLCMFMPLSLFLVTAHACVFTSES